MNEYIEYGNERMNIYIEYLCIFLFYSGWLAQLHLSEITDG